MKSRIMYIERKAGKLEGEARIGRVTFWQLWKIDLLQRTFLREGEGVQVQLLLRGEWGGLLDLRAQAARRRSAVRDGHYPG